jgi:hypothetical protein
VLPMIRRGQAALVGSPGGRIGFSPIEKTGFAPIHKMQSKCVNYRIRQQDERSFVKKNKGDLK